MEVTPWRTFAKYVIVGAGLPFAVGEIMSVRLSSVYLLQHSQSSMSPSTEKSSPLGTDSPVSLPLPGSKAPTAVAIVTPQRSNSLDFLNFEEKRQIIASSLSLTDFLQHKHAQGSATTPTSPTTAKFILGKLLLEVRTLYFVYMFEYNLVSL